MSNLSNNEGYMTDDEDESSSEDEEEPKAGRGKVEEESSEEEESETDNDAEGFVSVRREGAVVVAPKAANHPSAFVGKRSRDGEGKDEEPASKKIKETKGEKGRAPVKPASPLRSNKSDQSDKGGKAQVSKSKPEKAKVVSVEKEESTKAAAGNKKRKTSPPPANGITKQRGEGDKNSPLKPKTPFMWTNNLEIALANMLRTDKKHGRPIPSGTKNDPYWTKLVKELCSEGVAMTETQLSEKVRRMKNKWKSFKAKEVENPWRNAHEKTLFGIWDVIWGSPLGLEKQPSRSGNSQPAPNEEDEDDEYSDDEDVATLAVRTMKGAVQPSRKEESSESEEEEDEAPEVGVKKVGPMLDGVSKEGPTFSPTTVVSPFISKPRLEYTPLVPKDDKKKKKGEEGSIAEQSCAEASGEDEDRDGQSSPAVVGLLNSLKTESLAILQEVRASCLDALNNIRKQTTTVLDDMKDINNRLGINMPTSGMWRMNGGSVPSLDRGLLEDIMINNTSLSGANGANSSLAAELRSHWRQLRAEEMDLLEKRIQLTLKQLQLARKEFEEHDIHNKQ